MTGWKWSTYTEAQVHAHGTLMFHPIRSLKRHTGLWIARAVVAELRGIRAELANLQDSIRTAAYEQALRDQQRPPVSGGYVHVNVGQGFVTARPTADGAIAAHEESGSVDYTTDQRFAEYAQVANELQHFYKRAPTTEEIEREFLLRMGTPS